MQVMGHRGAKSEAPENTLKGIQLALNAGVKAIEIDVHRTRCGRLAVIHDHTLDRTTNGHGQVKDFTMEELKQLDAGDGERIPELIEVLELFKDTSIVLMIEIKADHCEQLVIQAIKHFNLVDQVYVIAFNHRFLLTIKELCPEIKTLILLYGLPINPVEIINSAKADGLSISVATLDRQLCQEVKDQGLCVTVWNINDEILFNQLSSYPIDYFGSDYPSKMISLIK